ncbi:uncharacterized protein LOC106412590 [Brassica napus]|uniref:uncharacterized protein LOC106412590 n=1 Tax=Brassica napus TaxID=3708 RepID=UPI0020789504|nr:uncharacterized protein LOC106412590 [Brassica napus]
MANEVNGEEFDEETVEREENEIEQVVEDFVDEPPVRHDECPSSEDEDEDEDEEGEPRRKAKAKVPVKHGAGVLYKGQRFLNGVAFKDSVLDYALNTGHNIKQYRYDKDKIGFICVGGEGCEWKVYASTLPKDNVWKVKSLHRGAFMLFVDKIIEEPEYYMPMKIEELVHEKWGFTVSRPQCQAARNKALKWIEFENDHMFARLRDYAAELVHSNPDSTVEIETVTNTIGQEEFNRIFICFDNIRRTWKQSCRQLIGVDGCFLKHKVKGQLLVALGRDADNAIYPIAWGAVQVENTENWLWFVRKIKHDLGLNQGLGYILVSDRQKGLISAVQTELPQIEHRMCVRHIYGNLKKNHASRKEMKSLIWNLAWSYNEAEFEQRLDRILCYDAESFNNTISKAREFAFVPMLEGIRRLAMARIAKRSVISLAHKGICTPYVTDFLKVEHKNASLCKVTRSTNGMYEVKLSSCTYRVSLERRTCTCMKFEICGIPCEHAYGVMLQKKLAPENYVCQWFRTSTWRRNYRDGLVPVRGAEFWPKTSAPDVHIPPAPPQPGRKKITKADKKRKKGVNESPTKKAPKNKKRIMHCGICGEPNHNSRFHTKQQASQGPPRVPSQVASPAASQQVASPASSAASGCHVLHGYEDMC